MAPDTAWFALSAAISSLGLLGMLVCRIGEGSDHSTLCQRLFVVTLLLVAASTLASLALHSESWVISGITLTTMAVGATLHTGHEPAPGVSGWVKSR